MKGDLVLPDPETVTLARIGDVVARAAAIRSWCAENRDVDSANELARRLAAFQRYVSDKTAKKALAGEQRLTEVLIGELLGPAGPVGRHSQGANEIAKDDRQRFRKLAENSETVALLVAKGVTERAKILTKIDQQDLAAKSSHIESRTRVGDFREVLSDLPDESVDLIFTDPPYDKDSLSLYADLAAFGARVLKPGGSLMAYCGQYALLKILSDMSDHLRYWWTCACVHDGGNHKSLAGIKTYVLWKPIVWFVKDTNGASEFVYDAILRPAPDKTSHVWAQALDEPLHYIEKLTPENGIVCDPFAGGGTTQLAAEQLGRRFIGAELDAEQERIATGRQAA